MGTFPIRAEMLLASGGRTDVGTHRKGGEPMHKRFVLVAVLGSALAMLMAGTAMAGSNTDHSPLTAQVGQGTGQVTVTSTPRDHGTFVGQVTANVQGTSPSTL